MSDVGGACPFIPELRLKQKIGTLKESLSTTVLCARKYPRRQNTSLHVVDVAGRDDAITVTCALRSQAVILLPESRRRPLPSWTLRSLIPCSLTHR